MFIAREIKGCRIRKIKKAIKLKVIILVLQIIIIQILGCHNQLLRKNLIIELFAHMIR